MDFLHIVSLGIFYLMANVIFFIFIRLPVTHQLVESDNDYFKSSEVINQERIIHIGQGLLMEKIREYIFSASFIIYYTFSFNR